MSCTKRLCKVLASALFVVAALAADAGAPRAQDDKTAEEVFRNHISGQIIQTKCINCHVAGGLSGNTRLVFVRSSDTFDHEARNLRTLQSLLDDLADEGGGTYILNKIQGVSHGGGVQVPAGTPEFENMARFLALLGEEFAPTPTPRRLFDTVIMASPRKTLRRAALIFAGRIPTEAEYAAVEGGDERALRATIRGLMEGPEFHEFLIRGSNDRLLTDRGGGIAPDAYFVDFVNEHYRRHKIARATDNQRAWNDFYYWLNHVNHGVTRAPLELIAYLVENDRPYTEILTADYVMANPYAAAAYGASTRFDDPTDPYEFRPSRIVSYYRVGEGYKDKCDDNGCYVLDPGTLSTDYPHAGILNTHAFLQRYPTTATNRNRARSRWTYYHFLGLDVEKSASRTTDPEALEDTNNPTMHNPNCTVCHSRLDPVAGAFQNYDEEGRYKSSWGGLDSLDDFYKEEEGKSLSIQAESWNKRETLVWPIVLAAGANTLRVEYSNHFWDDSAGEGGRVYLDRLSAIDADGQVIVSHEFEHLALPTAHWGGCGHKHRRYIELWGGYSECAYTFDLDFPKAGVYDIEIVAWSTGWDDRYEGEDGFAELSVAANPYQEGDTWYNDMRHPGFKGALAPHPDNSLQWLAWQIVADERFAEATVKFWWPAIMGSEVTEPPEDAGDADFEGRLLAFNHQNAEVQRLANGFRDGFYGGLVYNLKDLLVEIVLSEWFRADAVMDANPARRVALHDAGARRLFTPEELARKTDAITGVQWGRHIRTNCWPECNRVPSDLTARYRLLYGGIDSDGIAERARDITSVMAGVAKRHAAQVSCPVVMRELYLLPAEGRRLFAGIDPYVTPTSEFRAVFEIEAGSRDEKETLSLSGALTAGSKTVSVSFTNDYWHETKGDRNVRLDRLEVRNVTGRAIVSHEFEDLASVTDCNSPVDDHFALHCAGSVQVPIDILTAGSYVIEIVAWADQAGDELPRLSVVVGSDTEGSAGALAIKDKLVELHDKLLGIQVTPDSPEVEAAYRLFVDIWERGRESQEDWGGLPCNWDLDLYFFEGILDGALVESKDGHGNWQYNFDWDRIDDFLEGIDFSDPHRIAQAWVAVLAAMMMDYRYLYLN